MTSIPGGLGAGGLGAFPLAATSSAGAEEKEKEKKGGEEGAATPLRVRERAPLQLSVNVQQSNGAMARWGWDDPEPENVPQGLSFSTAMPGGFERMSCTLERESRLSYPDTALASTLTVRGAGGAAAWQGRFDKMPDVGGFEQQESPEAVGWQAHLEDDNSAREIYVDQELAKWGAPTFSRHLARLEAGETLEGASIAAGPEESKPGLLLQFTGALATASNAAEAWYDAQGIPIGRIFGEWKNPTNSHIGESAMWHWYLVIASTELAAEQELLEWTSVGHTEGSAAVQATVTTTKSFPWAYIRMNFTEAVAADAAFTLVWPKLAVYGKHGLALQGSEPGGLLASDVVGHAVGKWAPKLAFAVGAEGTIRPSGFVIPQLVFPEPTTVAEIVKQATRFELQDWAVWEGPTFWMANRAVSGTEAMPTEAGNGRAWRARVGPGQLQQAGPQMARLWNRVIVSYSDVTGKTRTVGAVGAGAEVASTSLEDRNPESPLNELGLVRTAMLKMGTSTVEGATKVGAIFLAESKRLETSGTASLVGHVEDTSGIYWPAWMVRAGDTISFTDAAITTPRRIVHTAYDDTTKANQLQLEQPPDSMTAILERLSVSIASLGVS